MVNLLVPISLLCILPFFTVVQGNQTDANGNADAKLIVGQSIHSIFLKNPSPASSKPLPICIVGGGISGLSLGSILQEKGHQILVFEKNPTVGGKLVTFRLGREVQVEMGPVVYIPSHTSLLKHIDRFKLTSVRFNESDRLSFDMSPGVPISRQLCAPPPTPTAAQRTTFVSAMMTYLQHRSKYERELDLEFGYKNVSADLFVSMAEWLESRNLTSLTPFFISLVTNQGYGALEDVAAMYGLKLAERNLILSRLDSGGTYLTLREGLDYLAQKMAQRLHPFVFRNSEIIRVSRGQNLKENGRPPAIHQEVFSFDKILKKKVSTLCQKVILAFPPLLNNVQKMVVDLTEEERDILSHVRIHKYTTAAHHIPGLQRAVYTNSRPKGEGEVVNFCRQSHGRKSDVYSSYSWIRGDFNATLSKQEDDNVRTKLAATLKGLSCPSTSNDRRAPGGAITFYRETSEYFPHVDRRALAQGFYEKFDSIQGKNGLYYATTLLGFETMNEAVKMTEAFAQKYF